MRGEKVVTFERPFLFSDDGKYEEGFEITVRAPSLAHLAVHGKMQSVVNKAIFAFASQERQKIAEEEAETGEKVDTEKRQADALQLVAAGSADGETYGEFLKWLKKTLTNQPKLAFVTGTATPVTDETWDSIEAEHGLAGVLRVFSAFTGFFLEAFEDELQNPSGAPTPGTSASDTRAPSITSTPARSPSKN